MLAKFLLLLHETPCTRTRKDIASPAAGGRVYQIAEGCPVLRSEPQATGEVVAFCLGSCISLSNGILNLCLSCQNHAAGLEHVCDTNLVALQVYEKASCLIGIYTLNGSSAAVTYYP